MSQASFIGLCSDNLVTILQPSSTIQCIGDSVTSSGTYGSSFPLSITLSPGNYILSINITTPISWVAGSSTALSVRVGSIVLPIFLGPAFVMTANTTTLSTTCNYVHGGGPIAVSITATDPTPALACSIMYTRVG